MKRIAIMTGGGDCAGINAFIAAAVRHGILKYGAEFVGIRKAYKERFRTGLPIIYCL